MKNTVQLTLISALLISLLAGEAYAGKKVYSPFVEEGEVELELQTDYSVDNDHAKDAKTSQKLAVGYTPNSWWAIEMGAKLERERGERQNASEIFFENIFQFTERGEYWLNAGGYLEYAVADDHPDAIEAKLLLSKDFDLVEATTNIVLEREIGAGSSGDLEWELASSVKYRYSKLLGVGLEMYNEFGDFSDSIDTHEHLLGPVVMGKWYGFKYDIGYLFGLTDESPDGLLKANFEIEF